MQATAHDLGFLLTLGCLSAPAEIVDNDVTVAFDRFDACLIPHAVPNQLCFHLLEGRIGALNL